MAACNRCKRPLRDPESVKRGLGRLCARKEGVLADRRLQLGASVFARSRSAIPGQISMLEEVDLPVEPEVDPVDRIIRRLRRHKALGVPCTSCGQKNEIGGATIRTIITTLERETKQT